MIKSIVPYTVLFFYIYAVRFVFLPVSTRVLFGIIGFIILAIEVLQYKVKLKLNKQLLYFLVLLFLIPFIALISIGINQTSDIEFVKYPISILTILFASYFVAKVLSKFYRKLEFQNVSLLIINIILIQSIIAFMMYLIPELRDFLLRIQNLSPDDKERISYFFEFRIIGFGTMFFGAGVISGFGLITIGALIRLYSINSKQLMILSIKFLIILVVGMIMARTTLIGGLLGLMMIFMPKAFKATISMFKKRIFFVSVIVVVPSILVTILYFLVPKVGEILKPVFNFAFEIFINYFEGGKLESESTNQLKNMYIFPNSIATWIIGDGFWANPSGSGYYMHTDVGYLRLIYYFGLIGLFNYLLMQFFAIRAVFKKYNLSTMFYLTVFCYLLILNLKGFADLLSFIFLYWMSFNLTNEGSLRNSQIKGHKNEFVQKVLSRKRISSVE